MSSKKLAGFQYPDHHKCSLCSYEKRFHSLVDLNCPVTVSAFGTTYDTKKVFTPVRGRSVVIRGHDSNKLHDPV